MLTRRLLPLLAAAAALLGAGPAHARPDGAQLSVMMDDDNLVYRSPKTSDKTLDTMAQLGVDTVRVTVLWKVVADHAQSTKARKRRFKRLGADNPKAYPAGNWDRYDHLVRSAGARGMGVYFDLTGPGPAWCCAKPPKSERENAATWMPSARQFKLFVRAIGKRYSGKYRDENFRGKDKLLPRVTMWALWNEPNQGGCGPARGRECRRKEHAPARRAHVGAVERAQPGRLDDPAVVEGQGLLAPALPGVVLGRAGGARRHRQPPRPDHDRRDRAERQ